LIEIRTRDTEKSAAFYENLFGWKVIEKETANGLDVWIFDMGGEPRTQTFRRGGIWFRPECEPLSIMVYIVVYDTNSILNKVTELGGKVIIPKTQQGPVFRACFTDLDGNLFGLWEERKDERSLKKRESEFCRFTLQILVSPSAQSYDMLVKNIPNL